MQNYHPIRGALFRRVPKPTDSPEKTYPVYDVTLEICGVKLRLAAWPKAKSPSGVEYLPVSGGYANGEVRRLVDVTPTAIASADGRSEQPPRPPTDGSGGDDLPF